MHFAIVEDLKSDQENLINLIREDCAAHQENADLSVYESGEAFLKEFRRGFCSAVFLDIMLKGEMTGLDTAWKIRETDEEIPIIFTTTERNFALESYGVHAMDFLVKPVQANALSWCLKRLRDVLAAPVVLTVRSIAEDRTSTNRMIPLDDILYMESVRNGLLIHTRKDTIRTGQTYADVVRQLPNSGRFYECSRGLTVNFSFVSAIAENGEISLGKKERIFCSRRKLKETLAAYDHYQFMAMRSEGVR
ncbi:MAG: LytTR family DNA-binding domain-containing protein [Lachnospiraceae bacterium]|nr:LytTR family DNA-binding domain-containing protein [Lachnospiraceae bacterium]